MKNNTGKRDGKLSRVEVAGWIRTLAPYLEKPMVLARGVDLQDYEAAPGKVLNYKNDDLCAPNVELIDVSKSFKVLVDLYNGIDEIEDRFFP